MGKYKRKIGANYRRLLNAVEERKRGASLRYLSDKNKIPKDPIQRRAKGLYPKKPGGPTTMSMEDLWKISN